MTEISEKEFKELFPSFANIEGEDLHKLMDAYAGRNDNSGGLSVADFKQLNPQLSHLEGDELWDAMTHHMMNSSGLVFKTIEFSQPISMTMDELDRFCGCEDKCGYAEFLKKIAEFPMDITVVKTKE